MSPGTQEISTVLCPASVEHCRQTEASIVPLESGRLFLAWTDFYGGNWHDDGAARIMGMRSENEGETWSKPVLVQRNIGSLNVMGASLLRLPSGRTLLAFMRKDVEISSFATRAPASDPAKDGGALDIMTQYSDDDCETWSEPTQTTTGGAYWETVNDRFLRLRTGRIMLPVREAKTGCHVWLSDDEGMMWRRGTGAIKTPEGTRYAEPAVVELRDGTAAMFIRTDTGNIHIAHSGDRGDTWTLHTDWGPCSPYAPCIVRRLPESDDILLIWNNHGVRSNLTAAISPDGGETWGHHRILEEQEDWPISRSHAYPRLTFQNGNAHLTYWETHQHPEAERLFHLVYRRLPIAWFYEKRPRRASVYDVARDLLRAKTVYDGEERE